MKASPVAGRCIRSAASQTVFRRLDVGRGSVPAMPSKCSRWMEVHAGPRVAHGRRLPGRHAVGAPVRWPNTRTRSFPDQPSPLHAVAVRFHFDAGIGVNAAENILESAGSGSAISAATVASLLSRGGACRCLAGRPSHATSRPPHASTRPDARLASPASRRCPATRLRLAEPTRARRSTRACAIRHSRLVSTSH
jgi:hypothetical protein